jgi:hypothetical protein
MTDMACHCRVCGLLQENPPWGWDGNTPTFEICDCCGTEFGYEDATLVGVAQKRETWLTDPGTWHRPAAKPTAWDPEEQLSHLPG